MKAKVIVWGFVLVLAALTLLNLVTPSRTFSDQENRMLQQMPEFSGQGLVSGKFTSDFDTFVTDQFLLRDSWVGIKTQVERLVGKQSSNGVYFADDGYLIEMFDTVNRVQLEKNLGFLEQFAQRLAALDREIRVETMLVPTSSLILADKLPRHTPEVDQTALLAQAAAQAPGFVELEPALSGRSQDTIYYRTDHHWTSLGAFTAYNAWRERRGEAPRPEEDFVWETLSEDFYGTTYSKASLYSARPDTMTAVYPRDMGALRVDYNMGETVTDSIYERSALANKDKYPVYFSGNQAVTRVDTGVDNDRVLLLVKDSYANTFAQCVLGDYSRVYMLDLRYYRTSVTDFVAENGVTDVLILYGFKNFSGDSNLYYLAA